MDADRWEVLVRRLEKRARKDPNGSGFAYLVAVVSVLTLLAVSFISAGYVIALSGKAKRLRRRLERAVAPVYAA